MQIQRPLVNDTAVYTDLNRLNQLKFGEERDSEENMRKVAQEFEAIFIGEMLKAMRSANDVLADGSMFNTNESKTYRDMHDQQLAVTLSQGRGIGMADVLVRQMSEMHQPRPRPNPFAQSGNQQEPVIADGKHEQALRRYMQVQQQSAAQAPAAPAAANTQG